MSEETTIDNGPQQDSGEKLVGVECYLWNDEGTDFEPKIGNPLRAVVTCIHAPMGGMEVPYDTDGLGSHLHARPVTMGLPEGGVLATEQATEVEGDALSTFPEDGDPDARKVSDLLREAGKILQRRNWPGAAFTLTEVSEGNVGAFGFNMFSLRKHMPVLLAAGAEGMRMSAAAQAIG
jgi:hypothetical protein